MHLNPSEISELIKSRIEGLAASAEVRTQGTIVSVTDGIVRIHGLSDVMQGEMLEFPGNTFGLALNLERDSVGAVIMVLLGFVPTFILCKILHSFGLLRVPTKVELEGVDFAINHAFNTSVSDVISAEKALVNK